MRHKFTLKELAEKVGGKIFGSPGLVIRGITGIETAKAGTLVYVQDKKNLSPAENSGASALLIPHSVSSSKKPAIAVKNPRLALAKLLPLFHPDESALSGIHKTAMIHPSASLGKEVGVGPYAVIGPNARIGDRAQIGAFAYLGEDVKVGEGTALHPRVTLLDRVEVGKDCVLYEGCIIGGEGFGYAVDEAGEPRHLHHAGTVILEDEVEIGANTAIDRALFGATRIGEGTKIDNLVHIAHNCVIGKNCFIAALCGLAGSVFVGSGTQIGGLAGVRDHVRIGERCKIAGGSMVWEDLPDDSRVSGEPARSHRSQLQMYAILKKLPELMKQVARLSLADSRRDSSHKISLQEKKDEKCRNHSHD